MGAGKSLQTILRDRNVTIAQLSRDTGISSNTLYAIIKRDSDINTATMSKIAQCLGLSVNELSALLAGKTTETAGTFPNSHILDIEIDGAFSDKKELINKLNALTQEYEEKSQQTFYLRTELDMAQKQRAHIDHKIHELKIKLEILENDLKTRRLELDMIREKF